MKRILFLVISALLIFSSCMNKQEKLEKVKAQATKSVNNELYWGNHNLQEKQEIPKLEIKQQIQWVINLTHGNTHFENLLEKINKLETEIKEKHKN